MTVKELNEYLESADYPSRFKFIQAFVFKWEVVASRAGTILIENDPADPGGATFAGLDRRSHPDLNFKKINPKAVCDTYLEKYWAKFDCEAYPYSLGEAFYNCCVNCGLGRAKKIIAKEVKDSAAFLDAQEDFYNRLAESKPRLKKFLGGWENRTAALRKYLDN